MGNRRGIKRDFKALERRRFEALKLLKKGYNQSEVGRRTKVGSQMVSRWAGRWNGTSRPSPRGRSKPGRQLKKSSKRRPHDRLRRRKRAKPAAAPLPHLGPARTDSGAAVSLQLEDHFRGRGHDAVELLLPTV